MRTVLDLFYVCEHTLACFSFCSRAANVLFCLYAVGVCLLYGTPHRCSNTDSTGSVADLHFIPAASKFGPRMRTLTAWKLNTTYADIQWEFTA